TRVINDPGSHHNQMGKRRRERRRGGGEGARTRFEDDFINLHVINHEYTRLVGYAESGHVIGAVGDRGGRPVGPRVPLAVSWIEIASGAVGVDGVQSSEGER